MDIGREKRLLTRGHCTTNIVAVEPQLCSFKTERKHQTLSQTEYINAM